MNAVCHFCGAKHWLAEWVAGSTSFPTFSHCCHCGKVALDPLLEPPLPIRSLLMDQTSQARHFCHPIRQYNSCFVFTSFRATENEEVVNGRGPFAHREGGDVNGTSTPFSEWTTSPFICLPMALAPSFKSGASTINGATWWSTCCMCHPQQFQRLSSCVMKHRSMCSCDRVYSLRRGRQVCSSDKCHCGARL